MSYLTFARDCIVRTIMKQSFVTIHIVREQEQSWKAIQLQERRLSLIKTERHGLCTRYTRCLSFVVEGFNFHQRQFLSRFPTNYSFEWVMNKYYLEYKCLSCKFLQRFKETSEFMTKLLELNEIQFVLFKQIFKEWSCHLRTWKLNKINAEAWSFKKITESILHL